MSGEWTSRGPVYIEKERRDEEPCDEGGQDEGDKADEGGRNSERKPEGENFPWILTICDC